MEICVKYRKKIPAESFGQYQYAAYNSLCSGMEGQEVKPNMNTNKALASQFLQKLVPEGFSTQFPKELDAVIIEG